MTLIYDSYRYGILIFKKFFSHEFDNFSAYTKSFHEITCFSEPLGKIRILNNHKYINIEKTWNDNSQEMQEQEIKQTIQMF